jgi:hypothetical protein
VNTVKVDGKAICQIPNNQPAEFKEGRLTVITMEYGDPKSHDWSGRQRLIIDCRNSTGSKTEIHA